MGHLLDPNNHAGAPATAALEKPVGDVAGAPVSSRSSSGPIPKQFWTRLRCSPFPQRPEVRELEERRPSKMTARYQPRSFSAPDADALVLSSLPLVSSFLPPPSP